MTRIRRYAASCLTIPAIANIAAACDTGSRTTGTAAPAPAATTLAYVSGTGQSALVNTTLGTPFTVKVLDQSGAVMPGVTVTWAVTSGDGSLSAAASTTNTNGQAATTYTTGATAGTTTVTATVSGLTPVPFTVIVTAS